MCDARKKGRGMRTSCIKICIESGSFKSDCVGHFYGQRYKACADSRTSSGRRLYRFLCFTRFAPCNKVSPDFFVSHFSSCESCRWRFSVPIRLFAQTAYLHLIGWIHRRGYKIFYATGWTTPLFARQKKQHKNKIHFGLYDWFV